MGGASHGWPRPCAQRPCSDPAVGYGRFGIRCNGIAPGIIATPGLRETAGEEYVANLLAAQLIPRLGAAEDIAAAVAYLASEASSFMTA